MTPSFSRGMLYVASGSAYRAEAVLSARSIRAAWPGLPIAIITDHPVDTDVFDIVQIAAMNGDNIDKVRYVAQSPFDRTILLDTDTYCLQPFPELFDLLDHFQLAAAYDTGRFTQRWNPSVDHYSDIRSDNIPECFPEFNTGVIAFRREPDVLHAFHRWLNACLDARRAVMPHRSDQPSFREVIYNSGIRVATLPSEYCFRLCSPDYARNAIKIIHGRWTYSNLGQTQEEVFARLGRTFNKTMGPRVLVHAFGIISGHGPKCIPLDELHEERELVFKELGDKPA